MPATGVTPAALDDIFAKLEKKLGKGSIHRGNEVEDVFRLPFKSPNLNRATEGGLPFGRFSQFWGEPKCLAPETLVLQRDYSWSPVGDLVDGDSIVGFDEMPPRKRRGVQRGFRDSNVVESSIERMSSRRLVFDSAPDTISSCEHLWLAKLPTGAVRWVMTSDLKPGDVVLRLSVPWNGPVDREKAAYIAGLFDGEGWFDKKGRLAFGQKEGAVLDQGVQFLKDLGFKVSVQDHPHERIIHHANGKQYRCDPYKVVKVLGSTDDIMRFLYHIPTVRLRVNAGSWWDGKCITPKGPDHLERTTYSTVLANEDIGERDVCVIGTSTRTLFANGLMSHNSMKSSIAYEQAAQMMDLPNSAERHLMPLIRYYRVSGDGDRVQRLEEELQFFKDRFPDGGDVALYNAEQVYDRRYAAKKGIDVDRLIVIESTMIEDVVESMEATYQSIPMHIVDSTTNCTSYEEQKMAMTDRRVGLDARVWKQTLRKSMRYWNRPNGVDAPPENFNIGILITQASTNIRTGGAQPASARFIGHTSAMTLKFQLGRFLWRMEDGQLKPDKPGGADDNSLAGRAESDGRQIFVECEKSRVCRLGGIAALQANYKTKDFDTIWELANAAEHFGVVQKSGSTYKIDGDEKAVRGLKGLRARIMEDPGLQERVLIALMSSIDE